MLYDDEQIVSNIATINEMAKEYAKSIETKRQEKLLVPLKELLKEQSYAQNCYNSLLKFAKQNALPFLKELLTDNTKNIEKIKKIISMLEVEEKVEEVTNNYVKIFKDALQSEIKSLVHCVNCTYNCKDDVALSVLNEIKQCCENHIEKLISCF